MSSSEKQNMAHCGKLIKTILLYTQKKCLKNSHFLLQCVQSLSKIINRRALFFGSHVYQRYFSHMDGQETSRFATMFCTRTETKIGNLSIKIRSIDPIVKFTSKSGPSSTTTKPFIKRDKNHVSSKQLQSSALTMGSPKKGVVYSTCINGLHFGTTLELTKQMIRYVVAKFSVPTGNDCIVKLIF